MAELPTPTTTDGDRIVQAIDDKHAENQESGFRAHLGASVLGKECERAIWYGNRWTTLVQFEGRMLRLFRRGHNEEFTFVDDLRSIGVEYLPENPATGQQWRYSILNGHVGGSCDGLGKGLEEVFGDRPFVGEFKTHSTKSFQKFHSKKALEAKAEGKSVLALAKPEHFAQCQLYMGWQGFEFALYLAVCKNDDRLFCEVVPFDEIAFGQLEAKARRAIEAPVPPARISDDPDFFVCRFCDHRETCHGEKVAALNCRTCIASTPNLEGVPWTCSQGYAIDDPDVQRRGCPDHRYIPDLVPFATAVEADEEARSITYELIATDADEKPIRFVNGADRNQGHYSSPELANLTPALVRSKGFNSIRDTFDGELVETTRRPGWTEALEESGPHFYAYHPESDSIYATSVEEALHAYLAKDPLATEIEFERFRELAASGNVEIADDRIPF